MYEIYIYICYITYLYNILICILYMYMYLFIYVCILILLRAPSSAPFAAVFAAASSSASLVAAFARRALSYIYVFFCLSLVTTFVNFVKFKCDSNWKRQQNDKWLFLIVYVLFFPSLPHRLV